MKTQKIKDAVVKFIKDEEGLTIVEYAVAGGVTVAAGVLIFTNLGSAVATRIQELIDAITTVGTP